MRASFTAFLCASAFVAALAGTAIAQDQGPLPSSSGTVAKKKPADNSDPTTNNGGDLPKIPSEYTKKDKIDTTNLQTFKTEVEQVTVDVAIMDNKGHFIPGIDKGYFRVLEDNVPQQVTSFNATGQAPMTVALLIEFSNKFQRLYGPTWRDTLNMAWGFASTLRPEDYCALISYAIKPEILTAF